MKRVLLKLSGEALAGDKKTGFDEPTVTKVAVQVKQLVDAGIQVGIVIGGGNFWRGRSSENIDRTKADQIGMLATVMNCIYVSEIFRSVGMMTQILTPFACGAFTKLFAKDRVNKYFEKGIVSFFAGGTGHPYFSTDTATVLRAIEIEADVILLAKNVDAVYDSDPAVNPDAVKFDQLGFMDVIEKGRTEITVRDGKVSANPASDGMEADIRLSHLQMMDFLFAPTGTMGVCGKQPALEKAWFPIPVCFSEQDNV